MFLFSSLQSINNMRTKRQQALEVPMTTLLQIKAIASRSHQTLVQDTVGVAALVVMLVVGLHLPTFI